MKRQKKQTWFNLASVSVFKRKITILLSFSTNFAHLFGKPIMITKKHNTGKLQSIVVCFFLLLNCVLLAAPIANATSLNPYFANNSGIPVKNSGSDLEENIRINDISACRHEQRITQRIFCKNSIADEVFCRNLLLIVSLPGQYEQEDGWLRPQYYSLLSLYYLF